MKRSFSPDCIVWPRCRQSIRCLWCSSRPNHHTWPTVSCLRERRNCLEGKERHYMDLHPRLTNEVRRFVPSRYQYRRYVFLSILTRWWLKFTDTNTDYFRRSIPKTIQCCRNPRLNPKITSFDKLIHWKVYDPISHAFVSKKHTLNISPKGKLTMFHKRYDTSSKL